MREPTLSELDGMVRDFLGQLLGAKSEGWDRSRPDHYRALLASLRVALAQRRAVRAATASASAGFSSTPANSTTAALATLPVPRTLAAKAVPGGGAA
jgi:hypothetical protein